MDLDFLSYGEKSAFLSGFENCPCLGEDSILLKIAIFIRSTIN
jgi:hypothetical protein